jgi:hypothetical protein
MPQLRNYVKSCRHLIAETSVFIKLCALPRGTTFHNLGVSIRVFFDHENTNAIKHPCAVSLPFATISSWATSNVGGGLCDPAKSMTQSTLWRPRSTWALGMEKANQRHQD